MITGSTRRMINTPEKLTAMKKTILYPAAMLLTAVLFSACVRTLPDGPATTVDDDLVALELVPTGGSVQITRANMNDISNAVVLVWDQAGTTLLHNRYLDYAAHERVYLRAGTYQIFAVANLTDANCPNGDAATWLSDVALRDDLNAKFLLADPNATHMVMCSGIQTKTLTDYVTPMEIKLRRLQTVIDLNIYNKISGPGPEEAVTSGVELDSFFTDNLPNGSWLLERTSASPSPSDDYRTAGYGKTSPTNFSTLTYNDEQVNDNWYRHYSAEIITFENRRGSDSRVTTAYQRKKYAPDNALEINVIGKVGNQMLDTFVLPGKGRSVESNEPDIDNITNFDVDRNCIYHVNVVINSTTNISIDSRREYLELVVCGDLETPGIGVGGNF